MTVYRHNERIFTADAHWSPIIPQPWSVKARCVGLPIELFVAPDNVKNWHPDKEVRALCAVCPVQGECLETALADRSLDGLWGGTTPRQRRIIRNRRGMVDRRKSEAPHGTLAAYAAHYRADEKPCEDCRRASARAHAQRKKKTA